MDVILFPWHFSGILWHPECHGIPWNAMDVILFSWHFSGIVWHPGGMPWTLHYFHGISVKFHGISVEFHGIRKIGTEWI